jgi:radical SAM superfamily enzyme YgiQ (UPF0313 family)
MDEELLEKLKRAGTYLIWYAIESVSPAVQKRIGKTLDLKKAEDMVRLTAARGILTCGYFMLGAPEETKEEMRETIAFAKRLPFHFAQFFYVTPRPDTPLYALLQKKGVNLESVRLYHYNRFSVNLSSATDAELKRLVTQAYAGFYLRPSQIWRILTTLPDKAYILKFLPVFLKRCFSGRGRARFAALIRTEDSIRS